jgi:hypothetical protein
MEKKSDGYSSELERGLSLNMTVTLLGTSVHHDAGYFELGYYAD